MTILHRVKKVINWLIFIEYAENDADLSKKMGYTKSSFSQLVNGKVPLSDRFIDKLAETNENINKVWISTGEGLMLKSEILTYTDCKLCIQKDKIISTQDKTIKLLEEKVEALNRTVKDISLKKLPSTTYIPTVATEQSAQLKKK